MPGSELASHGGARQVLVFAAASYGFGFVKTATEGAPQACCAGGTSGFVQATELGGCAILVHWMSLKIDQDHSRFRAIVRGKIRQNLRKYISQGELHRTQGQGSRLHPDPADRHPALPFGDKQRGGVGQGEGDVGDRVGGEDGEAEDGAGQGGQGRRRARARGRRHARRARRHPRRGARAPGHREQGQEQDRRRQGPLHRHPPRRSGVAPPLQAHLPRGAEARDRERRLQPGDPDRSCRSPRTSAIRSWKEDLEPVANAVIIYMMDVSGSMGDEQKEIVRIESFWIDTWLRRQYKGLESRYIIHDAVAREVDRDTFFHTRESGGTMISSAYKLCAQLIDQHYPREEWNIYPFHFSDGDNWSMDDTLTCVEILKKEILPRGEHVRLRPGREPVRLGPVHQGPARALRRRRARRHERDPRPGRDRRQHQGLSWARESECRSSRPTRTLPRYLRVEQEKIEKIARGHGLDFFPVVFEMLTYDQMNEIAAYGGFPEPLPALALRHGVRAAEQELRVRPLEDLRDGHQQQPVVRVPARGQLPHRSEARDVPRLRARRLLQEQLRVPLDRSRRRRARSPIRCAGAATTTTRTAVDRQDGEPRRRRAPHRRSPRHRARSRSSSTSACRSRT